MADNQQNPPAQIPSFPGESMLLNKWTMLGGGALIADAAVAKGRGRKFVSRKTGDVYNRLAGLSIPTDPEEKAALITELNQRAKTALQERQAIIDSGGVFDVSLKEYADPPIGTLKTTRLQQLDRDIGMSARRLEQLGEEHFNFDNLPAPKFTQPPSIPGRLSLALGLSSPPSASSGAPDGTQALDLSHRSITKALAQAPVYEKTGTVQLRPAQPGEQISTVLADGTVETVNKAGANDVVITNPNGEEYLMPAEKAATRYEPTSEPGVYKAKGMIRVMDNPTGGPIEITAPWGEKQIGDANAKIAVQFDPQNPLKIGGDRYIIAGEEFKQTYAPFDPGFPTAPSTSPATTAPTPSGESPPPQSEPTTSSKTSSTRAFGSDKVSTAAPVTSAASSASDLETQLMAINERMKYLEATYPGSAEIKALRQELESLKQQIPGSSGTEAAPSSSTGSVSSEADPAVVVRRTVVKPAPFDESVGDLTQVVYHGTPNNFEAYDQKIAEKYRQSPSRANLNNSDAIFYSDDPSYANMYTEDKWGRMDNGQIRMARLHLQNPYMATKGDSIESLSTQNKILELKAKGYDGFIYPFEFSDGDLQVKNNIYAIFDPSQEYPPGATSSASPTATASSTSTNPGEPKPASRTGIEPKAPKLPPLSEADASAHAADLAARAGDKLFDLRSVGPSKPLGYMQTGAIERTMPADQLANELRAKGLKVFMASRGDLAGHLFAYDEKALGKVLAANKPVLEQAGWPTDPEGFAKRVSNEWARNNDPLTRVISDAFGNPATTGSPEGTTPPQEDIKITTKPKGAVVSPTENGGEAPTSALESWRQRLQAGEAGPGGTTVRGARVVGGGLTTQETPPTPPDRGVGVRQRLTSATERLRGGAASVKEVAGTAPEKISQTAETVTKNAKIAGYSAAERLRALTGGVATSGEAATLPTQLKDLPDLKPGYMRFVHVTNSERALNEIINNGLNYKGSIGTTARGGWTDGRKVPYSMSDPRYANAVAVVMDIPQEEVRQHWDLSNSPGKVPPEYVVGALDTNHPQVLKASIDALKSGSVDPVNNVKALEERLAKVTGQISNIDKVSTSGSVSSGEVPSTNGPSIRQRVGSVTGRARGGAASVQEAAGSVTERLGGGVAGVQRAAGTVVDATQRGAATVKQTVGSVAQRVRPASGAASASGVPEASQPPDVKATAGAAEGRFSHLPRISLQDLLAKRQTELNNLLVQQQRYDRLTAGGRSGPSHDLYVNQNSQRIVTTKTDINDIRSELGLPADPATTTSPPRISTPTANRAGGAAGDVTNLGPEGAVPASRTAGLVRSSKVLGPVVEHAGPVGTALFVGGEALGGVVGATQNLVKGNPSAAERDLAKNKVTSLADPLARYHFANNAFSDLGSGKIERGLSNLSRAGGLTQVAQLANDATFNVPKAMYDDASKGHVLKAAGDIVTEPWRQGQALGRSVFGGPATHVVMPDGTNYTRPNSKSPWQISNQVSANPQGYHLTGTDSSGQYGVYVSNRDGSAVYVDQNNHRTTVEAPANSTYLGQGRFKMPNGSVTTYDYHHLGSGASGPGNVFNNATIAPKSNGTFTAPNPFPVPNNLHTNTFAPPAGLKTNTMGPPAGVKTNPNPFDRPAPTVTNLPQAKAGALQTPGLTPSNWTFAGYENGSKKYVNKYNPNDIIMKAPTGVETRLFAIGGPKSYDPATAKTTLLAPSAPAAPGAPIGPHSNSIVVQSNSTPSIAAGSPTSPTARGTGSPTTSTVRKPPFPAQWDPKLGIHVT